MVRLTISLLLLSCATTHDAGTPWARCYTPCGMRASDGDCESLQRFEARAVKRLALAVPAWREEKICAGLKGYEIKIHKHHPILDNTCSEQGWLFGASCIRGLTNPNDRTITLSGTYWDATALSHEIAHVADGVKPGHCPWKRRELLAAIYELSRDVDPSIPGPECSP